MSAVLLLDIPDLAHGVYPERQDKADKVLDRVARHLGGGLRRRARPTLGRLKAVADAADALADEIAALDDDALRQGLRRIAPSVARDSHQADLARALGLIREAAARTLAVRPYPTQLMGATVLLEGRLAEMQTGEGKTLTAALAACLAGVAGLPTHVVTVNDYLATRDAEEMGPLFRFFGLTVGTVVTGMDHEAKRRAYACSITYCTNKDLVFDYLRDRVTAGGRASQAQVRVRALHGKAMAPLLLRGLHFAIIDEADSILVDEARTPLILSEKAGKPPEPEIYLQALAVAAELVEGEHYEINLARRELHLRAAGQAELARRAAELGGIWRAAQAREHLAAQALRALKLFHRDQQYLVAEDKVHIVDEYTGRILPGRTWEQGLHQMIEAKEGVPLSEPAHTLARITYQRYFRRYLRLAGMTGTAREVAGELQAVYGLEVVAIPTYRPCVRVRHPDILCRNEAEKWRRVAELTERLQARGRPVLIGTRSVEASEHLSQALVRAGIVHRVLNARQDADEAGVVAEAGQPGVVTVATNMAGRGTDIRLGEGVKDKGGLTVILTEFHDSARIDRQLFGRCARQGDPGEAWAIVALEDALFRDHGGWLYKLLQRRHYANPAGPAEPPAAWAGRLRRLGQRHAERIHARTRRDTLKHDHNLDNMLAFAGNQI
jgi:preprotein translocase subunit SecA